MYEDQTFEVVMERLLSRIPDDIDKREGSLIYNALAPAALEFTNLYVELDRHLTLRFAGTTGSTYLELRVAEQGLERIQASSAKRRGLFYDGTGALMDVPLNSRFAIADLIFSVLEKISTGQYILECEVPGDIGNKPFGALLPIDYVDGLAQAELSDILAAGTEAESDESLQSRYDLVVQQQPASGNKAYYEKLAREVPGIADARIYRAWNGPGTVKVVLLSADKRMPGAAAVAEVAQRIEDNRPLDADVTVVGVTEVMINISATLTLKSGGTLTDAVEQIRMKVDTYLRSLAFTDLIIRYNKIGEALLDATDVIDYGELRINSGTSNIELQQDQVPVMGTVNMILGV